MAVDPYHRYWNESEIANKNICDDLNDHIYDDHVYILFFVNQVRKFIWTLMIVIWFELNCTSVSIFHQLKCGKEKCITQHLKGYVFSVIKPICSSSHVSLYMYPWEILC